MFAVRAHYYVTFPAFFFFFLLRLENKSTPPAFPQILSPCPPLLCAREERGCLGASGTGCQGGAGLGGRCPRLTPLRPPPSPPICLPLRGAQPLSPTSTPPSHPCLLSRGENTPSVPAGSDRVSSSLLSSEIIISRAAEVP